MADRSVSQFEIKSVGTPQSDYDVVILGGGLAGLCLALQLKRERPETSVLVAEKRQGPAPEAAFKVGESTVENGAHYYREVLGMADHLEEAHLRKLGLRFFIRAGDNSDITRRVEFATPLDEEVWTHQIDRGRFENELYDRCLSHGAEVLQGCRVKEVNVSAEGHSVVVERDGERTTVRGRWVVDAAGRSNILRNQLGLGKDVDHHINAAWFRLAGGMNLEDWTDDEEWLARMPKRDMRYHSTVHLVDEGYWVWLIQLASGPISIGIVADPRFHPFDEINEFDRALEWFKSHEPQLAEKVEARRAQVQDFLVVEDFSYGSTQVFSTDRWCLTGEAAGFIDAFYSPGSDFIAYLNSFSGDLIVRELNGEDIGERLEFYNFFFDQLFDPTVWLYKDQYQFFGNPQVMVAKELYDNTAYFATLAFLFLHGKMTQLEDLAGVVDIFETIIPLLGRMQDLYRDWHALDQTEYEGVSILCSDFEPIKRTQAELAVPFEGDALVEQARKNVEMMKAIAVWTFHMGARHLPEPPDAEQPINPLVVSLRPDQWEADGLFSDDGMTLAQAIEQLPGIEEFDLEKRGAVVASA